MRAKVFTLPGEWEKQSGVLITWPHNNSDWVSNLASIEAFYVRLSATISRYQKLLIIAYDQALKTRIQSLLSTKQINDANILFFISQTNDTWTRDYGPVCLTANGKTRLLDFKFNGWGEKYPAHLDNSLTDKLLSSNTLKPQESLSQNFVLEGGSIESDGHGTLLTTSNCLLNTTRNAQFSKQEIEHYLINTIGMKQILWLNHGHLAGDDTDSHIDMLARFTNAHTIIHIQCDDPTDEHFAPLQAMKNELKTFRNIHGEPYQLIPLPLPSPQYDTRQKRLPASYANFLIINDAVLVPTYDDPKDQLALTILQRCFKTRKIVSIPANAAIQQNGSLHCLTMQMPVGIL